MISLHAVLDGKSLHATQQIRYKSNTPAQSKWIFIGRYFMRSSRFDVTTHVALTRFEGSNPTKVSSLFQCRMIPDAMVCPIKAKFTDFLSCTIFNIQPNS